MFISVKVKINYNPLSKERLKRIAFVSIPIVVSVAITLANQFYNFIPSFREDRLFLYLQLFAGLCAVMQVFHNSKTRFYSPVDNMKSGVRSFAIWGFVFVMCHMGLIQFLINRMYSTVVFYNNYIVEAGAVVLLIPYTLIGLLLGKIFNFTLIVYGAYGLALSNALVGFFSVYCFLGAVIRLVKTKEYYKSLELVKR